MNILRHNHCPVILDGRHRLQALFVSQKTVDFAWTEPFLLVWCFTQHDGHPTAETEAFKLSSFTNKVTSNLCRDTSLVAIVKSVITFSAAFENEHGLSFLAARWMIFSGTWFCSSFCQIIACKHISAISRLRIFSFQAPIFSVCLRKLMRRR